MLLLTLFISLARADRPVARLDGLCGAYLTHAPAAGTRLSASDVEREILAPLGIVAASVREHAAGAGLGARIKNLFRSAPDSSGEHFSFKEEDLAAFTSALGRRDAARAIHYRLETLIADAAATPARAAPLSHVLRGRDEVLKFLRAVRGTADARQVELDARVDAHVDRLRARRARVEPPGVWSRPRQLAALAAVGAAAGGASLFEYGYMF